METIPTRLSLQLAMATVMRAKLGTVWFGSKTSTWVRGSVGDTAAYEGERTAILEWSRQPPDCSVPYKWQRHRSRHPKSL